MLREHVDRKTNRKESKYEHAVNGVWNWSEFGGRGREGELSAVGSLPKDSALVNRFTNDAVDKIQGIKNTNKEQLE